MKYDTAYDTKLLAIVRAYYILNNHKTYGNIAIVKQIKAVRQEVMIMKDVRSEVFNALEQAQKRGIKIRWVTDITEKGDNIYSDTERLMKVLPQYRTDWQEQKKEEENYKYRKPAESENNLFAAVSGLAERIHNQKQNKEKLKTAFPAE